LTQPAQALTDLLLGLVACALALGLHRVPGRHRYWEAAFWWVAVGALSGFVHHGVLVRWTEVAAVSWAVISVTIVLAVSYLLAATVEDVLGPGHGRVFWLLRMAGLLAYTALAVTGHAGVNALVACESVTFVCIITLWVRAAFHQHPMAIPVLIAIVASAGAGGTRALSDGITGHVYLDPNSVYHLAQIVGIVLLYRAVSEPRPTPVTTST